MARNLVRFVVGIRHVNNKEILLTYLKSLIFGIYKPSLPLVVVRKT
jgi:hypothetical protein